MSTEKELAGDEKMGKFVYCTQHHRVHSTGWCTVSSDQKIALESTTLEEAAKEWAAKKWVVYVERREGYLRDIRNLAPGESRLTLAYKDAHTYTDWHLADEDARDFGGEVQEASSE